MNACAEAADQLEAQFKAAGFQVVAINYVWSVVDYSKPYPNREEVAYTLGQASNTISRNKPEGKIPCSEYANGLYPLAWIDKLIRNHANPAGQEILKQLKA